MSITNVFRFLPVSLGARLAVGLLLIQPALAQTEEASQTRWELITSGGTALGNGSDDSGLPNLSGAADSAFLFRLDVQVRNPKQKLDGNNEPVGNARFNSHLIFETGIINSPTAVYAQTDPETSEALEALGAGDASVDLIKEIKEMTLSRERAFTVGGEYSANWLGAADGKGLLVEVGGVTKGHFDAFIAEQRFFEKNGVTYVRLSQPEGEEAGFFRGLAGLRVRVTQPHEHPDMTEKVANSRVHKNNLDDLLLFEFLYQYNSALRGMTDDPDINPVNRYVMRFMALPELPSTKHTKVLLGIEVSNDLRNRGRKDIQLFYGVQLFLNRLFEF